MEMAMKIAYNSCHGGFSLSDKAAHWMAERGHEGAKEAIAKAGKWGIYFYEVNRDDPLLIECIETLGKDANGSCARLAIAEIPDGVQWEIDEYDGNESVVPPRQQW